MIAATETFTHKFECHLQMTMIHWNIDQILKFNGKYHLINVWTTEKVKWMKRFLWIKCWRFLKYANVKLWKYYNKSIHLATLDIGLIDSDFINKQTKQKTKLNKCRQNGDSCSWILWCSFGCIVSTAPWRIWRCVCGWLSDTVFEEFQLRRWRTR